MRSQLRSLIMSAFNCFTRRLRRTTCVIFAQSQRWFVRRLNGRTLPYAAAAQPQGIIYRKVIMQYTNSRILTMSSTSPAVLAYS